MFRKQGLLLAVVEGWRLRKTLKVLQNLVFAFVVDFHNREAIRKETLSLINEALTKQLYLRKDRGLLAVMAEQALSRSRETRHFVKKRHLVAESFGGGQ